MHLYIVPCLQQNFGRKSSSSASLLKEEGIQNVFQKALMSVPPSLAEEGLEETLPVEVVNESAMVDFLFACVTH